MKVLVVEDERELAEAIARVIRRTGEAADVAGDAETATAYLRNRDYDIVVLDRGLPDGSGDDVCRMLAARATRPRILMLTARDAIADRVHGLDLGADDYVPKPVAMAELMARLRALMRRPADARPPVLRAGDVELDPARRTATRGGRDLQLARKEFAILEELLLASGDVVSPDRLLSRVWAQAHREPFENTVRVTLMRLRRKLGDPPVIETVVGAGYRIA